MKRIHNQPNFLPRYFRIIGFAFVVMSIILFVLEVAEFIKFDKEVFQKIDGSILLFGFLLIALTKDKIEDEFTLNIRLQAFTTTFLMGVLMTIFDPYFNLLLIGEFQSERGTMGTFIFLFSFYFFLKYKLKDSR